MGPGGGGRTAEVKAPLVINATGAWADEQYALPAESGSLTPNEIDDLERTAE